jgi:hypothetical protein
MSSGIEEPRAGGLGFIGQPVKTGASVLAPWHGNRCEASRSFGTKM